jgi:hydrogenase nickel incorporation protein HypA/HybF
MVLALWLMHEMSIAQSVLDIILQESRNHQISRVFSVALKVGELSAVETESLRFCFDLVARGTPIEGARLEIERVQVTCRCRDCGSDFTLKELVFSCPNCGGAGVEMLTGRELSVESFEAE